MASNPSEDKDLGDDAESPDIQPNSQYDQTISLNDSDEDQPGPAANDPAEGEESPREGEYPGPGDTLGNFSQAPVSSFRDANKPSLKDFQTKLGDDLSKFSPNSNDKFPTGLGQFNPPQQSGFSDYSPRPSNPNVPSSSPELAQLFSLISKYTPTKIDLTPHFKPFLPDLIPAIGSIDAFIKVPRPDNEQDVLGLTMLDEPTIGCSNPQILKMQLREKYGVVGGDQGDSYIGKIEDPQKNQKALESFLDSYDEISRNRAAPSITYSYKMPDIPELMELFPEQLEKALASVPLPNADIDLNLEDYARMICAMLGIPVKGNIVESLHVLFSLYEQFYENLYFNPNARGSTPKTQ